MRAQELIQAILSMLDRAEQPEQKPIIAVQVDTEPETAANFYDDELPDYWTQAK